MAYQAPQPQRPRTGVVAGAVGAAAVVLVAAVLAAGLIWPGFLRAGDDDTEKWAGERSTVPVAGPEGEPPVLGDEKPELRDVERLSVTGPTWSDEDDTYTMDFAGWPFAFRAGGTWGCIKAAAEDFPDAHVMACVNEGEPGTDQRIGLALRECPNGCGDDEQRRMVEEWLDHPDMAAPFDERTVYVERAENDRGRYEVDLSRFYDDGERTWQVGVYIESPADTRDIVQKALNDVVSQTQ